MARARLGDKSKRNSSNIKREIGRKVKREFLGYLAEGWSAYKAASFCGIEFMRWLRYRKKNKVFDKKWDEAVKAGVVALEDAAFKRAVKGCLKPVVSKGRVVTYVKEHSDSLLTLMLKTRNPDYAIAAKESGRSFDALNGAAERLLDRLTTLVEEAEKAA